MPLVSLSPPGGIPIATSADARRGDGPAAAAADRRATVRYVCGRDGPCHPAGTDGTNSVPVRLGNLSAVGATSRGRCWSWSCRTGRRAARPCAWPASSGSQGARGGSGSTAAGWSGGSPRRSWRTCRGTSPAWAKFGRGAAAAERRPAHVPAYRRPCHSLRGAPDRRTATRAYAPEAAPGEQRVSDVTSEGNDRGAAGPRHERPIRPGKPALRPRQRLAWRAACRAARHDTCL